MRKNLFSLLVLSIVVFTACEDNQKKAKYTEPFLSAKEAVQLNQLIYKDSIIEAFARYAPGYEVVFLPKAVNGNFAIIAKNKVADQYALVIRGSVIKFSNEGFQNFILQDFNIFNMKAWKYTDTIQGAYISQGAYTGFQNLLLLSDTGTELTIEEFIAQKIPEGAGIIITGHSLGGNLSYPLAGYLKKVLPADKKFKLQLITFGAPAAGNAAFVKDLEEKFPAGERYVTNKDIATVFPDVERINELASITGLDSVLQLGQLNINGITKDLNTGNLLTIANEILKKTNVINESNKYVQSQRHLKLLEVSKNPAPDDHLSAEAIFNKVYQFHKIDTYAELLGGKAIE